MEETSPRLVEGARFSRKRNVFRLRGRKLAGPAEDAGARVDVLSRLEQQILDRGVKIVANQEARHRRDERHVVGRTVPGEVPRAPGDHDLAQGRVKSDERVRPAEGHEVHAVVREELAHDGIVGDGEHARTVDLAAEERLAPGGG